MSSFFFLVFCFLYLSSFDAGQRKNIHNDLRRLLIYSYLSLLQLFVVQLISSVQLFATPWTAACRLPCPSPSPGVCSNLCPLRMMPSNHLCCSFSSCPQSFPALGSFPMSWLFTSGGQRIRASASASVFPINIHSWFPLGLTSLISLLSKGLLKSLLQHYSLKASILRCLAFSMVQLSHPYVTTGKTVTLTIWTFVGKYM